MLGRLNLDFLGSAPVKAIIGLAVILMAAAVIVYVPDLSWISTTVSIYLLPKLLAPEVAEALEQILAAYRTGLTKSERAELSLEERSALAFAVQKVDRLAPFVNKPQDAYRS